MEFSPPIKINKEQYTFFKSIWISNRFHCTSNDITVGFESTEKPQRFVQIGSFKFFANLNKYIEVGGGQFKNLKICHMRSLFKSNDYMR